MNITYSESIEKIKTLKEQAASLAKEHMSTAAKQIFEAYPKLQAFRWTQYTPYFNDGDECVFSSRAEYASVKYEEYGDAEDEEEGFSEVYTYKGCDFPEDIQAAHNEIKKGFGIVQDEDFKAVFGDHVQVTATRQGFEVEEYQHD